MLACFLPIGLLLSLLVGLFLCGADAPLQRFAGWLTLKPLIALPLLALFTNLFVSNRGAWSGACMVLTDVGLTLGLIAWYRLDIGRADVPRLAVLLLADVLRGAVRSWCL